MKLTFTHKSHKEIRVAVAYYDQFSLGIGNKFVFEVTGSLNRLLEFPHSGVLLDTDVRRMGVKNYPFVVLYSIDEEDIIILSVFNTYMNPAKMRDGDIPMIKRLFTSKNAESISDENIVLNEHDDGAQIIFKKGVDAEFLAKLIEDSL